MKRIASKSIQWIAFLIAGFAISRAANADTCGHLVSLASKIDRQARRLLQETHHYRHTPNYHRLVAEVATLRAKARHMRITTFRADNFHHLEEDLMIVDRCFHHVEDFFDHAEIESAHGHGHVHGNTRHVKLLLNSMEETIHHMQDDVLDLRRSFFGSGSGIIRSTVYGGHGTIYRSARTVIRYGADDDCYLDRVHRHRSSVHRDHHRYDRSSGLQINRGNLSLRIRF